jgi:hypothetical protein
MNDDVLNFPHGNNKEFIHDAPGINDSRDNSSSSPHVSSVYTRSVPQLVEEMIREGMTQCDSQQERDLIELEQSREAVELARDFIETLRRRKFCNAAWVAVATHISENWDD